MADLVFLHWFALVSTILRCKTRHHTRCILLLVVIRPALLNILSFLQQVFVISDYWLNLDEKPEKEAKSIWNMALNRPLANDSLNYCCNVNFRHFRQQGRKPDFPRLEYALLWTVTLIAVLEEQKLLRKCPMS